MVKNIIILGAGFGGLRAALDLSKNEECSVTLIDRNTSHLYYPALFEEAFSGAKGKCTLPIKEILKGTRVTFVQGVVLGIDWKERTVTVAPSPGLRPPSPTRGEGRTQGIPYEYLILALGADVDYFGIPGLKEYATVLRSVEDARRIRERVTNFFKKIRHADQDDRFEVMIGGAGATGVELAAALAYEFRNIQKERWSVTLVEALPNVLSMFPLGVSQYAHRRLEQLGVHLMLDTCIKSVSGAHAREIATSSRQRETPRNDETGIEVVLAPRPMKPGENEKDLVCDFLPEHEKRMQPDLLIWTGGVRANALLTACGMNVDRKGRLEVDEHLQVKGMEQVFAIGDNSFLLDPATKQPVPGNAQAALKEGKIVAENIVRSIRGVPLALYGFPQFPAIVPLGNRDAVALVSGRVIRGYMAHLLRHAADLRYFASLVGWIKGLRHL